MHGPRTHLLPALARPLVARLLVARVLVARVLVARVSVARVSVAGLLLPLLLALTVASARADEDRAQLRARGHHKKVVGAALMIVGGALDAATTALTFTGLARGGWSISPRSTTDTALLWTGVAGGLALDSILTAGIVIYCDGGQLMRRADGR